MNLNIKSFFLILITVIVIATGTVIVVTSVTHMGTVNQVKVTKEEFLVYAKKNENYIANQFTKENEISSYGSDFWSQEFSGKSPLSPLYEASLKNIVEDKLIFELATDLDVSEKLTFNA